MPNIAWYLILVLCSIMAFISALMLTAYSRLKLVYFIMGIAGMAFVFEFIIYILLRSYKYIPDVVLSSWYDSTLGSFISQVLVYPALTVCLVAFDLHFIWILIFAGGLVAVERLFIHLKIYHMYWWTDWYTFLFMMVGFMVGQWWWSQLNSGKRLVYWLNLYLMINTITHAVLMYFEIFVGTHQFDFGLFTDPARNSLASGGLFWFIHSVLVFAIIKLGFRWQFAIGVFAIVSLILLLLDSAGYLTFRGSWNSVSFSLLVLVIIFTIDKLFLFLRKSFDPDL